MKNEYITAVLEMLRSGKDPQVVFDGLKETLKKRGHLALEASVLAGVLRVIEAKDLSQVTVTVASQESYQNQAEAIKSTLTKIAAQGESSIKIDTTIIGGFIAEANNTRYDASYKTKLINLYRSLTT